MLTLRYHQTDASAPNFRFTGIKRKSNAIVSRVTHRKRRNFLPISERMISAKHVTSGAIYFNKKFLNAFRCNVQPEMYGKLAANADGYVERIFTHGGKCLGPVLRQSGIIRIFRNLRL